MARNRLELLKEWQTTASELARLKKEESILRQQVIDRFSKVSIDHEGTETVMLDGFDLKIRHALNYNLDDSLALRKTISRIGRLIGDELAERLVIFKPSLSVSEYRKLRPKAKELIDRHIVTAPASKQLEIKS